MNAATKAHKPRRRMLSASVWQSLRLAFIAGGGLRQLAREAQISEGTVLCRAAREDWSRLRDEAMHRAGVPRDEQSENQIQQSAAVVSSEQVQAVHLRNMLSLAHRLSDHATGLPDEVAFGEIRKIDTLDRMARRQLGLDRPEPLVSFNLFSSTPDAASLGVVIDEEPEDAETPM